MSTGSTLKVYRSDQPRSQDSLSREKERETWGEICFRFQRRKKGISCWGTGWLNNQKRTSRTHEVATESNNY